VGLPGHFVVRHVPVKGEPQIIDVYGGGQAMSRADVEKKVTDVTGDKLDEKFLTAVGPKAIILRMFNNLLRVAQEEQDIEGSLRYLDALIALDPDGSGRERVLRGLGRAQQGDRKGALEDLDWVLEKMPEDIELDRVRELRRRIERSR
jgi:serine protease Do